MFIRRTRERATLTRADLYRCWSEADAWACVYCGAPWEHADHFFPLARDGGHEVGNLWPSCEECNLEKSDRHPAEFLQSRGVPIW